MKLDKRIFPAKRPLTCFDCEEAKQFIGKECYFALFVSDFSDLNKTDKRILTNFDPSSEQSFIAKNKIMNTDDEYVYNFCLPCEWVSENPEEPEESEESEKPEEPEERDDMEDFVNIWFGCSSFGADGNLEVGKWSKLESLDLPFSKKRVGYLIAKYLLEVPDSENPRVPF